MTSPHMPTIRRIAAGLALSVEGLPMHHALQCAHDAVQTARRHPDPDERQLVLEDTLRRHMPSMPAAARHTNAAALVRLLADIPADTPDATAPPAPRRKRAPDEDLEPPAEGFAPRKKTRRKRATE